MHAVHQLPGSDRRLLGNIAKRTSGHGHRRPCDLRWTCNAVPVELLATGIRLRMVCSTQSSILCTQSDATLSSYRRKLVTDRTYSENKEQHNSSSRTHFPV
ncbi:hypothetical protein MRB53_039158 [Persea americana]|nr:hypothetical protein MRB53_039158 [Persea americana]